MKCTYADSSLKIFKREYVLLRRLNVIFKEITLFILVFSVTFSPIFMKAAQISFFHLRAIYRLKTNKFVIFA